MARSMQRYTLRFGSKTLLLVPWPCNSTLTPLVVVFQARTLPAIPPPKASKHLACKLPTICLNIPSPKTNEKTDSGAWCVRLDLDLDLTLQFLVLGPLRFGDAHLAARCHLPAGTYPPTHSACPVSTRFTLYISVRFGVQLASRCFLSVHFTTSALPQSATIRRTSCMQTPPQHPILPSYNICPDASSYKSAEHLTRKRPCCPLSFHRTAFAPTQAATNSPNTSHANAPAAPYPSIVQHLPRRPHPARNVPSPPAPPKNKRGGGFRKSVASRYLSRIVQPQCREGGTRYTSPAKPMKAMAKMPAVTSATGTPRMACGTSFSSSRSRMPAKTVSARAKPNAVETA